MTTLIKKFKKSDDQKNFQNDQKLVLNWKYALFGQNYRVATLSTFYLV